MKHCHPLSYQSTCTTHTDDNNQGHLLVYCAVYVTHLINEIERLNMELADAKDEIAKTSKKI